MEQAIGVRAFSLLYFPLAACLTLFLTILYRLAGPLCINVLLFAWMGVASASLAYGMIFDQGEDIQYLHEKIVFQSKPNVYLFILESYQNIDVLQNVYGVDTTELEQFIKRNQFVYFSNVYSNSTTTLLSMVDIFAMQPSDHLTRGLLDGTRSVRLLIGGDANNFVNRVFKDNGYTTGSIYSTNYYMFQKGHYLDYTNISPAEIGSHSLDPFFLINKSFVKFRGYLPTSLNSTIIIDSSYKYIYKFLFTLDMPKPYFLVIKDDDLGALHSHTDNYTWRNAKQWIESSLYKEKFIDSQKKLLPLIDEIIAVDPSAVIILLGDHGASRYRNFFDEPNISSQKEYEDRLAARDISKKDLADDFFGTFCAIRMPAFTDISSKHVMSHRNIFRYLFAALSGDPDLLQSCEPNISRLYRYVLVKDGHFENIDNVLRK
jgi:hypothetical protein